jgi:hypothetical protein
MREKKDVRASFRGNRERGLKVRKEFGVRNIECEGMSIYMRR